MSERATVADEHASHVHANRVAILEMIAGMACFVVSDALMKYASQTMPGGQLIFVRGIMAVMLVLAVAKATGAISRIREAIHGWVAVRSIVDAAGSTLFLVSLFHMPIGSATAINIASPLFITLLAAVFLHERVGPTIWLATGAGFVGVLLIIQPKPEGFNAYALVCLASTVLLSVRDLMTRRVHAGVPSILLTLATTVTVTLLTGVLTLYQGWVPFGAPDLGLLALAACFFSAAYFLIVQSTRGGELSLVAPFRYTALLFATIMGFVVWGDLPNLLACGGIVLVIASGIYVLRRSRRARAADPAVD